MMNKIISEINLLSNSSYTLFITSINYEERCTGITSILDNKFKFDEGLIFLFKEEQEEKVEENLQKILDHLKTKGPKPIMISSDQKNPYENIQNFCLQLKKNISDVTVILDITTFPIKHLFLLLKTLDDFGLWEDIRIFYTEPEDYKTNLYLPMSIGIGSFDATGEFISKVSPSLPLTLIEFLGYERDRAKAIFDDVEPDETVLVIPKPAYHPSWDGRTESFNNTLRKIVGTDNEEYASSFDPDSVVNCLNRISQKFPFKEYKWIIVPLGTKPQSLGIYLFWRKNPNMFSILFADSLRDNPAYYPRGIGKFRILFQK